jgi:hypothetical protein
MAYGDRAVWLNCHMACLAPEMSCMLCDSRRCMLYRYALAAVVAPLHLCLLRCDSGDVTSAQPQTWLSDCFATAVLRLEGGVLCDFSSLVDRIPDVAHDSQMPINSQGSQTSASIDAHLTGGINWAAVGGNNVALRRIAPSGSVQLSVRVLRLKLLG